MAKKRKTPIPSSKKNPFFPQEVKSLSLLVVALLLFVSLISFTDGDATTNWLGFVGYSLAWIFLYIFGLGSYLIAWFLWWNGYRMLLKKPIVQHALKCFYFGTLLFSMCILLNLFAEAYPRTASYLKASIYTQQTTISTAIAYQKIRYNLGGVPFYFLYRDVPLINLQYLLSNVGTLLVLSITVLVSALQITHWQLFTPLMRVYRQAFKIASQIFSKKNLSITACSSQNDSELKPIQKGAANAALKFTKKEQKKKLNPLFETEEERLVLPSFPTFQRQPPLKEDFISIPSMSPSPKPPNKREAALQAQQIINGDFQGYKLPPLSLLTDAKKNDQTSLKKDLQRQARILEDTLLSFGIEAKVGQIYCGPTIASFEVHPAVGVKVQKIKALESDIALNLQAKSIRIIAPIPGKAAVGIEIPSSKPQEVSFKEMLFDYQQGGKKFQIPALLGKTVSGEDVVSDLAKMPHCIIAGATGSGKSVCINTIVMTILMTAKPDEIKMLMVDPKKVELTAYTELPHMIAPVITEPAQACAALNWLVKEMERRYNILKKVGVRNIVSFNSRPLETAQEIDKPKTEEENIPEKLPYIVAIIDELADLMMLSTQDIETPIARIAQMARAVGIHLILATQRPSREVITGLIKANFPTRIAFKVSSRINSQIILDDTGADSLLGNGDMLFLPPGSSSLLRAQGAFIRDEDINKVVEFIQAQAPPSYLISSFESMVKDLPSSSTNEESDPLDSLYHEALATIRDTGNASTTFLQRKLKIGYARAASLMDQLEGQRVIGPADGSKPRKIFIPVNSTKKRNLHELEEIDEF